MQVYIVGHSCSSGLMHRFSAHFTKPYGQVDKVGHCFLETTQDCKSDSQRSFVSLEHFSRFIMTLSSTFVQFCLCVTHYPSLHWMGVAEEQVVS